MQKWHDATGNQIIQSLIRNTKSGKGKPVIDPERKRGFGEVDLNALLTVDPTQYKDVNPILEYQMKAVLIPGSEGLVHAGLQDEPGRRWHRGG